MNYSQSYEIFLTGQKNRMCNRIEVGVVYYLLMWQQQLKDQIRKSLKKTQISYVSYLRYCMAVPCLAFNSILYFSLIAIVNELQSELRK